MCPVAFLFVRYGRLNSMYCSNTDTPREEPKTVWWEGQMAQAASMMNYSMSVGLKSFLFFNQVVWSILLRIPYQHSNVEFACGFFTVVSLHSMTN